MSLIVAKEQKTKPMRRALFGLAFILIGLCVLWGILDHQRIEINMRGANHSLFGSTEFHDFGVVPTFSHFDFDFTSTNPSSTKVLIDSVESSCGCTQVVVDRHEVDPGQSFHVKVRLSTGSFRGIIQSQVLVKAHSVGQIGQYLYRLSARAGNIIEFPGLEGPIRLSPSGYNEIRPDHEEKIVRGESGLAFTEVRASSNDPTVVAHVDRITADEWRLSILEREPATVLGEGGCDLTFTFVNADHQAPGEVYRHVVFRTDGPILASPSSIMFYVRDGQAQHQTLEIRARDVASKDRKISIIHASASSSDITIADVQRNGGTSVDVTFKSEVDGSNRSDSGYVFLDVMFGNQTYHMRVGFIAVIE